MSIKQALLIGVTGFLIDADSPKTPFPNQTKKGLIETLNPKQEKQSDPLVCTTTFKNNPSCNQVEKQSDPLVCTTTFKNNPSCNQVEKLSDQAIQKVTIQDLEETPFR